MTTPTESETPAAYVETHRDELADLTLSLLAVDTANPPGDTREIVDLIEQYLDPYPAAIERVAVDPAKPNLLVRLPGERNETILYNGHTDTVPYDAAAWSHDPLGERVDDRLYGRGATDMKGPLAAMLFAITAFVETETTPATDLLFAFVSDEEVGGDAGLPALVDDDLLEADACVIGEPTCEAGRHSVTVADRGSIWLTLAASGASAHGSRPMLGENAIDRLYEAVRTLRERFGTRALEVPRELEPIIEDSVEYYAPTMGAEAARELFASPSINLGTIAGGDAINSVPQSARAEIDIRATAGVQTSDVLSDIRRCVADCEGIAIADASWSVGTAEAIDDPFVEAVASSAESVAGGRIYRRSATGGGDAKRLRNAGIPTVEFAFGTDTVHAVDEYVPVDALVDNALVYVGLPSAFTEARGDSAR
ncbi:M20 family metallopeptidase [Halorubellus sp. JP-L1]|uniref:M20 family metallopeptidase n=1 Tax=Halorubellus sp. JP-L1 TaxID=2715753 RepID=UPI00140D7F4D|nr:M20/M25/M40 family metallo-hydrolase [Halorubellus sp. JP-L1]NHN42873.1 M20 family metallopeptidase [Halorubellus sp. JP-L1]